MSRISGWVNNESRHNRPATGQTSLAEIANIADRLNQDLLSRSRREARAGARLVALSETAGRVLVGDEAQLLQEAGRLAAEEQVFLFPAYGVWALWQSG